MTKELYGDVIRIEAAPDRAYFDKRGASVKNALVSELKKFWPIAAEVWPTKFLYTNKSVPAENIGSEDTQE